MATRKQPNPKLVGLDGGAQLAAQVSTVHMPKLAARRRAAAIAATRTEHMDDIVSICLVLILSDGSHRTTTTRKQRKHINRARMFADALAWLGDGVQVLGATYCEGVHIYKYTRNEVLEIAGVDGFSY